MGRKYREYTYEEYVKAMELLEKGYGLTETCRLLGWSEKKEPILYYWKHGKVPPLARWTVKPSRELAYIIGVIQGDACVTKDEARYQYIVKLATIDKEFAITFSRAMARLLNKRYIEPRWDKKQKKWTVKYDSKAFYIWYKKTENQGLEGFKSFIEYSKETVRYYLKGLFDSDGNNNGNKQIFLCNSNIKLLRYVQYLLNKYFNIKATGPYLEKKAGTKMMINRVEATLNQDYYYISVSRKLHVQKFLREIGFTIMRKQLGLKKHGKVLVEGIGYMRPYELVKLGLFKLPFSDSQ